MTKGITRLMPQELQPMPRLRSRAFRGKELGVALAASESHSKPRQTGQDHTARQKYQIVAIVISVDCCNAARCIQPQGLNPGLTKMHVPERSYAICEPD